MINATGKRNRTHTELVECGNMCDIDIVYPLEVVADLNLVHSVGKAQEEELAKNECERKHTAGLTWG